MQQKFSLTEKLPPYVFEAIYALKKQAKANGIDVIDFGIGNPDLAPPQHIMEKLSELSKNPKLYGYSVVGGIEILKKSLADYYQRRFGVDLNYKDEALVTIGAKEGLTSLATAISDSDNYLMVPSPSYPIHTFAFIIAKSKVVHINAVKPQEFLVEFKKQVENSTKKPIAVLVNYPNNPTSETVDLGFYEELVAFCKKHQIYIISDLAYAEIYFNEKSKPNSILEIPGAKDIAIEFSSVSKSYGLPGARIGFAAGNKNLINALYKIKSYLDYGSFEPLQIIAAEALTASSDEYLKDLRAKYFSRAKFLTDLLNKELNWQVDMPKAGMFLWTKIPEKFKNYTSFDFCKKLIFEAGVAISPGSSFGSNGEGYVRFSLVHEEENMKKAVNKLKAIF